MNTKKEIVEFLEEIVSVLQDKRLDLKIKIEEFNLPKNLKVVTDWNRYNQVVQYFKDSLNYTEGQLSEANYILSTITRNKRKKDK